MGTYASCATLVVKTTIHSHAFFLRMFHIQTHKNSANNAIM